MKHMKSSGGGGGVPGIDGSRSVDRFLLAENEPFYFVYSSSLSLNELWTYALFKVNQG